jgi:hypothetical protein
MFLEILSACDSVLSLQNWTLLIFLREISVKPNAANLCHTRNRCYDARLNLSSLEYVHARLNVLVVAK